MCVFGVVEVCACVTARVSVYACILCMWIAYAKGKKSNENTLKKSKSDVFTYYGMCTICDKKNWEMGRRGDSGNTTAIATALTHDEKKNSVMWEPIFWRGFFSPPSILYVHILFRICSISHHDLKWKSRRKSMSMFLLVCIPLLCLSYILWCVYSLVFVQYLCVCVARSLFLPTLSPPIHLSIGEISRTTHLQSIVRLNLYI